MKKILTAIALMGMSLSGMAQTEYSILRACHPDDVKHYDTEQLRSHFMMPKVMEAVSYTHLTLPTTERV